MASNDGKVFRIGLTGGIASGKSVVANLFADLGARIIDTDEIAHQVVEPGEPALDAVGAEFGPDVLTSDGRLDRAALRERVFGNPAERLRLEAILHPSIRQKTLDLAESAGGPYQIIVVPLLFETDFAKLVDRVLVVDCPEPMQLRRLADRDGEDAASARRMLAAQLSRAERLRRADDVIDNGGSLAETLAQVEILHARYVELAARH